MLFVHLLYVALCKISPTPLPLPQVNLSAKAHEAALNARVLSLESQIHWLGEQNAQLTGALAVAQEGATQAIATVAGMGAGAQQHRPAVASVAMEAELGALGERCAALEADLRKAKRAELKLQALLYR